MKAKEILIIEDEPDFREILKRALKGKGYSFIDAKSVQEGIDQLSQYPNIRIILLDLILKEDGKGDGVSGEEFLKHIKERIHQYRVIVLTAHDEKLAADVANKYGVFNYLPKASRLTQPIRFSVNQAFKDIEREQLKDKNKVLEDKNEVLIKIQKKINSDIQESGVAEKALESLSGILNLVCQSVKDLVGAYTCHIRLYNLKTGDFDLAAFAGPTDDVRTIFNNPRRKGEFCSGIAAKIKKSFPLNDLQNDEIFRVFKENLLRDESLPEGAKTYLDTVRSAYIAPITTHMFADETDAVFNVGADSVAFFSEERQEIIKEFVTQATIAITKAWQKKRREETHQDYKGISKVLEDISKALRGKDFKEDIYNIAINGISEIIRPETITIFLYNKTTGRLDNEVEFRGNKREKPRKEGHPTDEGLTGLVFKTRKPLRIPNLQSLDRRRPEEHPNYNRNLEANYVDVIPSKRVDHYLGVPMIIGNEVIGAIQLLNKKSDYHGETADTERWLLERGFSDDCENALGIAASHLAVAIKNAELLEERDRKISQLETLKDVGRYTSREMPLNQLLKKTIEDAAKAMQAEICLLFLLDGSKGKVILEECYGIPKAKLEGAEYKLGEGLTGSVALTGNSELQKAETAIGKYDDKIKAHLQQIKGDNATIQSLMAVPIRAKGEILGVIKAINKISVIKTINPKAGGEQYNDEDLSFFESFGSYVGIAIENAQRYVLTNEKLAVAEKSMALSHLVRAVVHEINNTKALIPLNVKIIRNRISDSGYIIKESLKVIEDSARRAVEFANSIQAFSASRLGEKKDLDIKGIVEKAIQQLIPALTTNETYKTVRLENHLSNEHLECNLYETPFIQVVQNVILNAYQAMEKSKNKILTITSYKNPEKNRAKIEFTDTGQGIKKENLNKLFDPEFTTKVRGTGIGLWLAKMHLDVIGASIKITKSILNEGTTITIEIPLNDPGISEKKK